VDVSLSILNKEDVPAFVRNLLRVYRVGGPVETNGHFAFKTIREPAELRLDYPTTILPPKKFLLPPKETLFEFDNAQGLQIKPPRPEPRTVVFGVHTCDLHAIRMLDHVFDSGHPDPNYNNRRRQTLIISIECLSPCDEHSFCKSMGTLSAEEGFDLHLTDIGDRYTIDIGTEAGEKLLEHAPARNANPDDIHKLNSVLSEKWPKFPYRLDFDVSELPSLLNMNMQSPLWNELGERCLACASCTNVCPTCFCFDINDDIGFDQKHGQRTRVWDSCQLDDFATVAGGHNFRKSRALRQRHRFMRKGKYILETHHFLGCVGCGRCARACLVDITPVGVFNELYHRKESGGQP
jgi:sulfhydrogenase subunit beta (sulfur reductase)